MATHSSASFSAAGPIIKAEVGEQIVITFKNKASRPYSMTAHGVKASGAHIPVAPGENNTNQTAGAEKHRLYQSVFYFRLHSGDDMGRS